MQRLDPQILMHLEAKKTRFYDLKRQQCISSHVIVKKEGKNIEYVYYSKTKIKSVKGHLAVTLHEFTY